MVDKNHPGREHIDPRLLDLIDRSEGEDWLFVKNLKEGAVLEVQTRNTVYTMKVLNPEKGTVLVNSNGSHVARETKGAILGSSLTGTGTMIKVGGIAIGLRLVIATEDTGQLVPSTTQEVRVNGTVVLPVSPLLANKN